VLEGVVPRFSTCLFVAIIGAVYSQFLHAEDANYFLIRYLPGENWNHTISYQDQPGLKKHHAYLQKLHIKDQVVMGGPVSGEPGSLILVRTSSREQAETIARQDPGVETRIVKAEVTAWNVQMSSMRFVRRQPAPLIENPDQTFRLKRIDLESRLNIED
jgi:uncharacterized protein YciI